MHTEREVMLCNESGGLDGSQITQRSTDCDKYYLHYPKKEKSLQHCR